MVEEELNPNDPSARAIREAAVEYADRVASGEKPWEDTSEDWSAPKSAPKKATESKVDNAEA